MPIYEYRCRSCGFEKEYLQKLSDAPITDCPQCGKAEMGKLVSAAGFQLKGSGWYVTDFKNNGAGKKDGGAKKEGGEQKDSGEKKDSGDSKDGPKSGATESSGSSADKSSSEKSAAPACGAGACPACS